MRTTINNSSIFAAVTVGIELGLNRVVRMIALAMPAPVYAGGQRGVLGQAAARYLAIGRLLPEATPAPADLLAGCRKQPLADPGRADRFSHWQSDRRSTHGSVSRG